MMGDLYYELFNENFESNKFESHDFGDFREQPQELQQQQQHQQQQQQQQQHLQQQQPDSFYPLSNCSELTTPSPASSTSSTSSQAYPNHYYAYPYNNQYYQHPHTYPNHKDESTIHQIQPYHQANPLAQKQQQQLREQVQLLQQGQEAIVQALNQRSLYPAHQQYHTVWDEVQGKPTVLDSQWLQPPAGYKMECDSEAGQDNLYSKKKNKKKGELNKLESPIMKNDNCKAEAGPKSGRYQICDINGCTYESNRLGNLRRHRMTQHGFSNNSHHNVWCCFHLFKSKHLMKMHTEEVHKFAPGQEYKLLREGMEAVTINFDPRKKCPNSKTMQEIYQYWCPFDDCQAVFSRKAVLERHYQSHDNQIAPFKCRSCLYKTSHKANCVRHYIMKHLKNQQEDSVARQDMVEIRGSLFEERIRWMFTRHWSCFLSPIRESNNVVRLAPLTEEQKLYFSQPPEPRMVMKSMVPKKKKTKSQLALEEKLKIQPLEEESAENVRVVLNMDMIIQSNEYVLPYTSAPSTTFILSDNHPNNNNTITILYQEEDNGVDVPYGSFYNSNGNLDQTENFLKTLEEEQQQIPIENEIVQSNNYDYFYKQENVLNTPKFGV